MFLPERSQDQDWFGVVIAIPEPWVSELTELRCASGDPQGSLVPAHITLLPPIAVSTAEREEIIRHLRTIASNHRPFRVTLRGTGSFRPISQVAFIELATGALQCTELADDIRSGPLNVDLRFPYHPHVTLAQGIDDAAMDQALNGAAHFEASWIVPGFRLDRVDENGMYSSMALFNFEAS